MVLAWAVGIILTVGLIAGTVLTITLFPDSPYCGEYTGCLGLLVHAWEVGRWVVIVLAWPLLYLLRVRPSLPAAALAALLLMAIWQFAEARLRTSFGDSVLLIFFSGVISYPAAAWLARTRIARPTLVLSVASLLAFYLLAAALLPD
ncbi:hypothetical protein [Nonomuraea sp. NPDC049141]|uniref:hypothetical protein n=1 Tax=Nonomuraea sp. NPDC049141 TaxID=3155500 RepID=UPI0033F4A12E